MRCPCCWTTTCSRSTGPWRRAAPQPSHREHRGGPVSHSRSLEADCHDADRRPRGGSHGETAAEDLRRARGGAAARRGRRGPRGSARPGPRPGRSPPGAHRGRGAVQGGAGRRGAGRVRAPGHRGRVVHPVVHPGARALRYHRGGAQRRRGRAQRGARLSSLYVRSGGRAMKSPSVRIYYDLVPDRRRLDSRTIAVIGYGSQGHAHALNLRESGARVTVGLRPDGASARRGGAEGLDLRPVAEAAAAADIIMMLVPDQAARAVYEAGVAPALAPGKTLMFAHGFNVHFQEITPPPNVDVSMIAPKSPGHLVRSEIQAGRGVPALVAVHHDASPHALQDALAYAFWIGCNQAGVIETTFREETETDLFGEQAVLCGGVTALVKAGVETLVQAGYSPGLAYFECMHELKLIVDLMYRVGLKIMRHSISDTAQDGDYTRGPRLTPGQG